MAISEEVKKAFDLASDATKQLIALSTGLVGLTITFAKDALGQSTGVHHPRILVASWIVHMTSIFFGLLLLQNLAGNLEKPKEGKSPSIYTGSIVFFGILQMVAFLAGTIVLVVFGLMSLP